MCLQTAEVWQEFGKSLVRSLRESFAQFEKVILIYAAKQANLLLILCHDYVFVNVIEREMELRIRDRD